MMIFRPTIRQLSFLTALYQHRHFSRAAEACFVTQSTLSAGIQELEAGLGASLVERTKRVVRFTDLGEKVVHRAQSILAETDHLVDIVRGAGDPLTGDILLGAIPTIGPFVLPRVLPQLKRKFPEMKLYLREGQTEDTLARLKNGALDVGLIAFPYPIQGVVIEIIRPDPFYLVVPNGHSLGRRKKAALGDFTPDQLLLLEEGHCLRDHALSFCEIHNLKAGEQFKATSLETLVLMVAEGLGLTLVPEIAVAAGLLKGKALKAVPLDGKTAPREIGLCWRASNPRGEEYRLLARELKKML